MARLAEADYLEGRLDEAIPRLESAFEVLSGEQEDRDLAVLAAQLGRMRFFAGISIGRTTRSNSPFGSANGRDTRMSSRRG